MPPKGKPKPDKGDIVIAMSPCTWCGISSENNHLNYFFKNPKNNLFKSFVQHHFPSLRTFDEEQLCRGCKGKIHAAYKSVRPVE